MTAQQELEQLGLPAIDQLGFVVRDLKAWTDRYEAVFGPFTYMNGSVPSAEYRGRTADAELKLAFGRSGDLEIEFIEWVSGDSPHKEFIERGGEGMHHIRYRVDDANHWIEQLKTIGFNTFWYKQFSADTIFAYLEREDDPVIVEVLQMPTDGPGV